MRRALHLVCFALPGLALVALGLFFPAYFRAVDSRVIRSAGAGTPSLSEAGLALLRVEKPGPARMLLRAAQELDAPHTAALESALADFGPSRPEWRPWGGPAPLLHQRLGTDPALGALDGPPILEILLRQPARSELLKSLSAAGRIAVQPVLQSRSLTNLTTLSPVGSAAGQPLEAVIVLTALLLEGDLLSVPLRADLHSIATHATLTGEAAALESVFMDLLSLGVRLNWVQLTEFIRRVEEPATLNNLAAQIRARPDDLPVIYAAVLVAENPRAVAAFCDAAGPSAADDLRFALRAGTGGVRELVVREKRLHRAERPERWLAALGWTGLFDAFATLARQAPLAALFLKYFFLLAGGFLVVHAIARPLAHAPDTQAVHELHQIGLVRHAMFALLWLFFLAVLSEPFLADRRPTPEPAARWDFSVTAAAVQAIIQHEIKATMDTATLTALVGFLVIQAIIYSLCLLRLADIRRQPLTSRMKLRLLDNEENLFDAGLYVGLGGTVVALVFLALGIIQPSLMAAYSSTLFGLVFVGILKICHVRPVRRRLILEAEPQAA